MFFQREIVVEHAGQSEEQGTCAVEHAGQSEEQGTCAVRINVLAFEKNPLQAIQDMGFCIISPCFCKQSIASYPGYGLLPKSPFEKNPMQAT
jgi:hypothetical protein